MNADNAKGILEMASGAIQERADYEMSKIIDNILDVNTKAIGKRSLSLTVNFVPDSERKLINVSVVAKSKLEPTNPVSTALFITDDHNGELVAVEVMQQVPGQQSISGEEQGQPPMLRVI